MPDAKILRIRRSDQGTEGSLVIDGSFFCYTLELPWRDNKNNISCIPPGEYRCEIRRSPKFGNVYWVRNVPGREFVLIHNGNWAGDIKKGYKSHVQGCILVGKQMGYLQGQRAVLNSKLTLVRFMEYMDNKPFKLEILEGFRQEE